MMKLFMYFFKIKIPAPYSFLNIELRSDIGSQELTEIVTKINDLLPQFSNFIDQFNNLILNTPINVITESNGNMAIDVPSSMPDEEAEKLSKKIGIIDRLIMTRNDELNSLFQKGMDVEAKIKQQDSNFTSKILPKIAEYEKLNEKYRH